MLTSDIKDEIFSHFLSEMKSGPERALSVSFSKYAVLRDKLIEEYFTITGIPKEEFHNVIARKLASVLLSRKPWY
jgi:uncharacterized protein with HEPN domain